MRAQRFALTRPGRRANATLALAFLLASAGCTVLTDEQVDAVGRFAAATEAYDELPGAVVDEHARLRTERRILDASTRTTVSSEAIEKAVAMRAQLEERARKIDAALEVLATYSRLLKKLTSADFTVALEASATNLASEVDGAVEEYRKMGGSAPDSAGAMAAAVVRGAGGWFIRSRQLAMLREAVMAADPVVAEITKEIESTLALYTGAEGLAQGELDDLAGWLQDAEPNVPPELRADARQRATELIQQCADLERLAARSEEAARLYHVAHEALVKAVQESASSEDLATRVRAAAKDVRAIAAEVKAAQRLHKRLIKG